MDANFGILSVIPMFVLLILAIKTRKVLESVVVASILAYIIAFKGSFFTEWVNGIYSVIGGDAFVYVLLIVGIFGGLIKLIQDSGGALGFGHFARKYANTQRKSLIITYILGIIVFVDEYLNALAVTAAMRNLTDEHKVPREMLACTVNTAGTPVCAIIPFSTWGAFYIALIADSGILEGTGMSGLDMYYKTIPFMVYPLVMMVIMALLIVGIMPKFGTLKRAYERVEKTGKLLPEGKSIVDDQLEDDVKFQGKEIRVRNFLIPMLALVAGTVLSGNDILVGSIFAVIVCGVLYISTKNMTLGGFINTFIDGIKDMVYILVMILFIFVFVEGSTQLGFAEYIINAVVPYLTPGLLPPLIFLVLAFISFGVGSYWSISVIALPIVIPLAIHFGISIPLMLGVIISAAVFGSQACFYCEVIILAATAAQVEPAEVGLSNLPYALISVAITTVIYAILPYVVV